MCVRQRGQRERLKTPVFEHSLTLLGIYYRGINISVSLKFLLSCFHVPVCRTCICAGHTWGGQRSKPYIFFNGCPPSFLRQGLTEPGTHWLATLAHHSLQYWGGRCPLPCPIFYGCWGSRLSSSCSHSKCLVLYINFKMGKEEAGEMAPRWREQDHLPGHPGSVPSIHQAGHTVCN